MKGEEDDKQRRSTHGVMCVPGAIDREVRCESKDRNERATCERAALMILQVCQNLWIGKLGVIRMGKGATNEGQHPLRHRYARSWLAPLPLYPAKSRKSSSLVASLWAARTQDCENR